MTKPKLALETPEVSRRNRDACSHPAPPAPHHPSCSHHLSVTVRGFKLEPPCKALPGFPTRTDCESDLPNGGCFQPETTGHRNGHGPFHPPGWAFSVYPSRAPLQPSPTCLDPSRLTPLMTPPPASSGIPGLQLRVGLCQQVALRGERKEEGEGVWAFIPAPALPGPRATSEPLYQRPQLPSGYPVTGSSRLAPRGLKFTPLSPPSGASVPFRSLNSDRAFVNSPLVNHPQLTRPCLSPVSHWVSDSWQMRAQVIALLNHIPKPHSVLRCSV